MPKGKKAAPRAEIAVIGGSGLYNMPGLEGAREVRVKTPFGDPSDALVVGELKGVGVAFLPRHGRGHRLLPGELNQRANIWALKSLGVRQALSLTAVGSLREDLPPRTFVFPDQLVDRTKGRVSTFFGQGVVGHVSFARPFCPGLSDAAYASARALGLKAHPGGVFCCMEGPAFSTRAESELHRKLGFDLIGMTVSPEAKLAREAELCYAPIAMVTDFDCWKAEDEVTGHLVAETVAANAADGLRLVARAVQAAAERSRDCECPKALAGAIMSQPQTVTKAAYKRLELLIAPYVPRPR